VWSEFRHGFSGAPWSLKLAASADFSQHTNSGVRWLQSSIGGVEMNDPKKDVIQKATDAVIKAYALDIDIVSDNLKFSTWITALCTAGLAFIITGFDKIVANSWMGRRYGTYGIIAAGILLFCGAIIGGLIHHQINKLFRHFRVVTAGLLRQQLDLLSKDNIQDDLSTLVGKIKSMGYIPPEAPGEFKESWNETRYITYEKGLIFIQQLLAAIGYILAFACGITSLNP
jgi:hypothetical protein